MILYLRNRHRLAMSGAVLAAFLFGCFVFGVLSVRNTTQGVMLIGVTFSVIVYWIKPQAMMWITLFLAFASLPAGLPPGKVIGPVAIYGHHVPLVLALLYLIPIVRPPRSAYLLPGMFLFVVVCSGAVGLANGNAARVVVHEATFLFEMIAGFMLAQLAVYGNYIKGVVQTLAATLWISVGLAVSASLHIIQLSGREESLGPTMGSAATRVITNTLTPAIAVLTVLVVAQIIGSVKPMTYLVFAPPALIIPVLAFSRNTLIAVGVAAVVAFVCTLDWSALHRVARLLVTAAAIAAATVAGGLFLLQHSTAGAWFANQVEGFNHRVLGGVSADALAVDSSTLARLAEDANLNRAIAKAPVFGHGLGYAYQLAFGDDPDEFTNTLGTTYSHNFYLWWLAKSGAVGMAAFAVFALTPVIAALRSASAPAKISAALSAGLLVMCIVDPLPEDPANALTLGMALGAALAFARVRPRSDVDGANTEAATPTSLVVGQPAAGELR